MTHVMNSVNGHEKLKKCSKIKSFSPRTINNNVNNNNNITAKNLNVYNSLRRSINKNVSASKLLASEAIRQSEVRNVKRVLQPTLNHDQDDVNRAMNLLVTLLLKSSLERGECRVSNISQSSVQVALASLSVFSHKAQRERLRSAQSLLLVLFLDLSLARVGVNVSVSRTSDDKIKHSRNKKKIKQLFKRGSYEYDEPVHVKNTKNYAPLIYHGNLTREMTELVSVDL